ncbi:MAG TPA: GGDEF domain-containing protein [Solirubrobacteraceae bacterium]|nr:GGDEF domain-containing protein [Solirubrobacteraceae bacterium]
MPSPPPDRSKLTASSWLCPEGFDRERMLDMEGRVGPGRRRAAGIMTVAILACGPWLGWWPLLLVVVILGCFATADRLMPRLARPELLMFAAWVGSNLAIAVAVAIAGPAGVGALSLMVIPVITLSSRFSMRGVAVGVVVNLTLILLVALTVDRHGVLADPVLLIVPIALSLCAPVLTTPLMRSDIQHRADAVIDQLTGMLNRKALATRARELAEVSALSGEPVGVVVADIDHFKRFNDTHGHAGGDVVLQQVAYVLRKQLRAFDLAYRLGGEEFLILLPGSDLEQSVEIAERLHDAVGGAGPGAEIAITMSFGVAASDREGPFDYDTVFAGADAALYEAKRTGRNRVCRAGRRRPPVFA